MAEKSDWKSKSKKYIGVARGKMREDCDDPCGCDTADTKPAIKANPNLNELRGQIRKVSRETTAIKQEVHEIRRDVDALQDQVKKVDDVNRRTETTAKRTASEVLRVRADLRKMAYRVDSLEIRQGWYGKSFSRIENDIRSLRMEIAKLKNAPKKDDEEKPFGDFGGFQMPSVVPPLPKMGTVAKWLSRAGILGIGAYTAYKQIGGANAERDRKLGITEKDIQAERGAGALEKTPIEQKRQKFHRQRRNSAYDDLREETKKLKEKAAEEDRINPPSPPKEGGFFKNWFKSKQDLDKDREKIKDLTKIPQARASFFGFGRKKPAAAGAAGLGGAGAQEEQATPVQAPRGLTFRDQYERSKIEDQKSDFMNFGKLPTGFEFLEGHMGRLGTSGALKAAGIQPNSGSESFRTSPGSGQHRGFTDASPDITGTSNEASKVGNWKGPGDAKDNLANVSANERRVAMYQAFRKQGISHQGAVMMSGEIGRENDYRANFMFGNHVDSSRWNSGIMSWNSDHSDMNINSRQGRRGQLLKFLGEKGHLMDDGHTIKPTRGALEAQAEFLVKEMETGSHIGGMNHPKAKSVKALLEKMRSGEKLDYQETHRILGKDLIRWAYDRLPHHRQRMAQHEEGLLKDLKARPELMGQTEEKPKRSAKEEVSELHRVHKELEDKNGGAPVDPNAPKKIPDAQDLDAPQRVDPIKKKMDDDTVRMPNDDPVKTNPKLSGRQYGPGANLSEGQLVRGGTDPMLAKAMFEGAKVAFGDPNDPRTRYVLQAQGGYRPGAMKHGQGAAIDHQIFDRKTGKYVGGNGNDIMSNAYDNPKSFRHFEAMHQGAYKYLFDKYGKQTADQLSSGLYFSAVQGTRGDGFGIDNMHLSVREGQRHGRISTGLTNEQIKAWIARHGGLPSRPMGDPAKWQSEFHPDYDPKNALQPDATKVAKDRDPKLGELQSNLTAVPEDLMAKEKPKASFPAVLPKGEPTLPKAAPPGLQAPDAKPVQKPNLDLSQPPPDLAAPPSPSPADAKPAPGAPSDRGPQMPVAPPSELQGSQTPNLKMPTEAPPDLQAPAAQPGQTDQPSVPGGDDGGFRRNNPETQQESPGSAGMGSYGRCFVALSSMAIAISLILQGLPFMN